MVALMETTYKISSGGIVLQPFDETFSAAILNRKNLISSHFLVFLGPLDYCRNFALLFIGQSWWGAKQSEFCYILLYIHLDSNGARAINTAAT